MEKLSRLIGKIPEPFTLSMILTAVALIASKAISDLSLAELSVQWSKGLWSILAFAMQMVLVLSTGFALAQAPVIERRLKALCALPKNYAQSVGLVAFVSIVLGTIHWGLGLAGGTLLVRQMNRSNRQSGFHGPIGLMGAAGYLPLMIWHGGFSGSAPLLVADDSHFLVKEMGTYSLAQTIGHWSNLLLLAVSAFVLPLVCYLWAKRTKETSSVEADMMEKPFLPAEELSPELRSPYLGSIIGLVGLLMVFFWLKDVGLSGISLDHIIAVFLFLALLFHFRLGSFLEAFKNGVMSSWSVVLLFPFYGAIMAVVKESGLAAFLSETLAENASAATLPIYTFLSAGVLNIFVPSGGGQWVVQGPIAIAAAQKLGVANDVMVMAVAYGDQITNMLQPFWALPLLGMTRIPAKELLRFTVPLMFVGGGLMLGALMLRSLT